MNPKNKQFDMPLFDIRPRKNHPVSSKAECQRQNDELSESMRYALRLIWAYPGHSARELEKLAHCEPGRIWKVAAQLERRGLIERRREGSHPLKLYPTTF